MNNYKDTLIDNNGFVKARYMFLIHLAGVLLPIFIWLLVKGGLHTIFIFFIIVIALFSSLFFVVMRLVLKLIETFIKNTALKFGIWCLSTEAFAYLYYHFIALNNFKVNENGISTYKTFIEWHFDIFAFPIYFCPIYFTIVAGFILELFYTENKKAIRQQDVLDNLNDNF